MLILFCCESPMMCSLLALAAAVTCHNKEARTADRITSNTTHQRTVNSPGQSTVNSPGQRTINSPSHRTVILLARKSNQTWKKCLCWKVEKVALFWIPVSWRWRCTWIQGCLQVMWCGVGLSLNYDSTTYQQLRLLTKSVKKRQKAHFLNNQSQQPFAARLFLGV